jgi:GH24 family phage-related lysozyme (muramidase)
MLRTAGNSLKQSEAIAFSGQEEGYKNKLSNANSNGLYNVQLKQRSSFDLKIEGIGSKGYVELIQDRNRNAYLDQGETLGRSRLKQGVNSLKVDSLDRGTYFLQVHVAAGSPATYQLALSTNPASAAASSTSNYQYLKSDSSQSRSQSRSLLGDLVGRLFEGSTSSRRWNASFINRTSSNVDKYNTYDFSRPVLAKDLGGRGKSGKTLAKLKVDYGTRSPGSGVQADNYAMEAWTRVSLKEGKFYQVKSDSNDGTRFFFRDRQNGKIVTSLNGDWRGSSTNAWTQLLSVPEGEGGSFDFYVQHYDRTGTSAVNVVLEEVQPTATVVASTTLNLRSQPSTINNTPITAINSGTSLKILRQVQSSNDNTVPDWYQVVAPDGRQGYVAAQSDLVQINGGSDGIAKIGNGNNSNGGNNGGGIQSGGNTNNPPRPTGGSSSSDGKISQKGIDLVKSFEGGPFLEAYRDPVGIWTIGYGTTSGVKAGMRITKTQAEQYLREDLNQFERAVKDNVKVPLNTEQFSALVSFTYNVGEGALASSTLLRFLNQGDYQGAADEFLRWNKGGGQELPGLTRRRNAERSMFLGQDYTAFL